MPSSIEPTATVFIYGTLMRGESRHHAIRDQEFIGTAKTTARYRLHLIADYPGMVAATEDDGYSICGELWSVDQATLRRLDSIECVDDGLFRRIEVSIAAANTRAEAWIYQHDVSGLRDLGGDWRSR